MSMRRGRRSRCGQAIVRTRMVAVRCSNFVAARFEARLYPGSNRDCLVRVQLPQRHRPAPAKVNIRVSSFLFTWRFMPPDGNLYFPIFDDQLCDVEGAGVLVLLHLKD